MFLCAVWYVFAQLLSWKWSVCSGSTVKEHSERLNIAYHNTSRQRKLFNFLITPRPNPPSHRQTLLFVCVNLFLDPCSLSCHFCWCSEQIIWKNDNLSLFVYILLTKGCLETQLVWWSPQSSTSQSCSVNTPTTLRLPVTDRDFHCLNNTVIWHPVYSEVPGTTISLRVLKPLWTHIRLTYVRRTTTEIYASLINTFK